MSEQDIEELKKRAKYSKFAALIMVVIGFLTIGILIGYVLIVGGLIVALYWYLVQNKIDLQDLTKCIEQKKEWRLLEKLYYEFSSDSGVS